MDDWFPLFIGTIIQGGLLQTLVTLTFNFGQIFKNHPYRSWKLMMGVIYATIISIIIGLFSPIINDFIPWFPVFPLRLVLLLNVIAILSDFRWRVIHPIPKLDEFLLYRRYDKEMRQLKRQQKRIHKTR